VGHDHRGVPAGHALADQSLLVDTLPANDVSVLLRYAICALPTWESACSISEEMLTSVIDQLRATKAAPPGQVGARVRRIWLGCERDLLPWCMVQANPTILAGASTELYVHFCLTHFLSLPTSESTSCRDQATRKPFNVDS